MSTMAQMKALAKPLLARNPDLVMIGRVVFIAPIRHLARFICLDNTSGTDGFNPRAGALHLFEYSDFLSLTHTRSMGSPGKGLWLLTQPGIQSRFLDACENTVLPWLRAMESIADYAAFSGRANFPDDSMDMFALRQISMDVALGDFEAARATCDDLASGKSPWRIPDFEEEYNRILTELWPALKTDNPATIAAVLHRWEAYTVKALKLEKYWEPTPFPIEEH